LELPPVFHPSRANGVSEFSEIHANGVKISNLQNCRRDFVKTSKNSFKLRFYWFSEAVFFRKMAFPAFPKIRGNTAMSFRAGHSWDTLYNRRVPFFSCVVVLKFPN
jgi:hypothetical protein